MSQPDEPIDRTHVREPREVSGWGRDLLGNDRQDVSDIAKDSPVKPEFEQGTATRRGRGDATPTPGLHPAHGEHIIPPP